MKPIQFTGVHAKKPLIKRSQQFLNPYHNSGALPQGAGEVARANDPNKADPQYLYATREHRDALNRTIEGTMSNYKIRQRLADHYFKLNA